MAVLSCKNGYICAALRTRATAEIAKVGIMTSFGVRLGEAELREQYLIGSGDDRIELKLFKITGNRGKGLVDLPAQITNCII